MNENYYNIFQGNKLLQNTVAKTLGYESPSVTWFTEDMYFESFFYLSKRFGPPQIHDEHKDAGVWEFRVKQYYIQIYLNSSWVSFMMFGQGSEQNRLSKNNFSGYSSRTPYWMRYWREAVRKKDDLVSTYSEECSERENQLLEPLFQEFCSANGIGEDWDSERFWREKGVAWMGFVEEYNRKVIGISYADYEKYGEFYQNSKTKHALKTMEQFLRNMLSPISVRDCYFNIKGRCSYNDGCADNIKIIWIP